MTPFVYLPRRHGSSINLISVEIYMKSNILFCYPLTSPSTSLVCQPCYLSQIERYSGIESCQEWVQNPNILLLALAYQERWWWKLQKCHVLVGRTLGSFQTWRPHSKRGRKVTEKQTEFWRLCEFWSINQFGMPISRKTLRFCRRQSYMTAP